MMTLDEHQMELTKRAVEREAARPEWLPDVDMPRFEPEPVADQVFRPAHYDRFVIEPATFSAANGLSFLEGNVVKYTVRAPYKGREMEDLKKARRCLDMLIESAERKARVGNGENAKDVWKETL